jgi:hypothetical protein
MRKSFHARCLITLPLAVAGLLLLAACAGGTTPGNPDNGKNSGFYGGMIGGGLP